MRAARIALALTLAAVALAGAGRVRAEPGAGGSATLSVSDGGTWRVWWREDRAPARWNGPDSVLAGAVDWQRLAAGLEWASVRLACGAPAWRAKLILARLDPREVSISLVMDHTRTDHRPAWTIDRAPGDALLAVNAGQFVSTMPWGWVFAEGVQRLRPGYGPLSSAFAIDGSGSARWVHGDTLADVAGVVSGFQSYPTLLAGNGEVPAALRTTGSGVNLTHRDARLALGETRDGRLLIAMTRFDAMGEIAAAVPLGPTTPEMAAIMGALGACDAVMLDGGISAQLLLRGPARKDALRWPGMRKVPLALVARPRGSAEASRAP